MSRLAPLLLVVPLVALLAGVALVAPPAARAATYTVTTLADGGPGSLRWAIADANASVGVGDTITFQAGLSGTIVLTGGRLTISDNLTIDGPGAGMLAVSGNHVSNAFIVSFGVTAAIEGLTIRDGQAVDGGGIVNNGTLTITNSTLSDNTASSLGGGIWNEGTLTVVGSTLAGNHAAGAVGLGRGGGIANNGTLTITNSTLSGNIANRNGGGIYNSDFTTLSITGGTLAGNRAIEEGGGIFNSGGATLAATIVAASPAGGDCAGPVTSGGRNLDSDGTCFTGGTGLVGVDPILGPLADNGGPTLTHLPQAGSPAIDAAGPAPCPTATDQRGVARPQLAACDIGAVEVAPPRISSLAPNRVKLGSPTTTVKALGSGFVNGAVVTVGGQARQTTFVSANELRVVVPASDLSGRMWWFGPVLPIKVINPGNVASNTVYLGLTR